MQPHKSSDKRTNSTEKAACHFYNETKHYKQNTTNIKNRGKNHNGPLSTNKKKKNTITTISS